MALHVFDDDDRVVNHQACGQSDAEERECIDGEAEQLDKGECADERDRDGDRRNDGGAPVKQEKEDDHDNDDDGLAEREQHLADGIANGGGGVERHGVLESRRKALGELLQHGLGLCVYVERVGVGKLLHADALRGHAVVLERRAVGLRANLGVTYFFQKSKAGSTVLHDDVVEFGRAAESAYDAHGNLESLLAIGRRLAKLAGGNLHVLLGERTHNVASGKPLGSELSRIEPDAHGIFALAKDLHVADAGHALERVLYVNVEVIGDELVGVTAVAREEACAKDEVAIRFGDGDSGGVDSRGKASGNARNAVLHIDGSDVEVVAGLKGDGDHAGAAVGAGGADVAHALDTVDSLFKRNSDGLLDCVRVGSHIVAGHHHFRRRQRGIHGHWEIGNTDCARQDNHQCAYCCKHWPVNKEINKQSTPTFLSASQVAERGFHIHRRMRQLRAFTHRGGQPACH